MLSLNYFFLRVCYCFLLTAIQPSLSDTDINYIIITCAQISIKITNSLSCPSKHHVFQCAYQPASENTEEAKPIHKHTKAHTFLSLLITQAHPPPSKIHLISLLAIITTFHPNSPPCNPISSHFAFLHNPTHLMDGISRDNSQPGILIY